MIPPLKKKKVKSYEMEKKIKNIVSMEEGVR
jgi:hypothetical protein